ncbi:type VI secretion system tip protein VgrG [Escherichia coli]|nr:type VI secretion system tip protein VgrG [Escherichia coli]
MSTGLRFTLEVDGLPPDAFAVVSFHLNQSLSSLFSLDLSLVSQQFLSLAFAQVLDKMAYLTIWQGDEVQRRVKGVVTWFELGENDKNQMLYSMKVHPPLWRAGLRQNFRIFQNEDIKSILGTMLQENGVTEWSPLFSEPHPSREFCVQYGETDYDFLCRMAAEEGIFFYEEHAYKSTDQSLVLCDTVRHLPESFEIPWNPNTRTEVSTLCISQFRYSAQIRPSSVVTKDYTFKRPGWAGRFEQEGQHQDYHLFYEYDAADRIIRWSDNDQTWSRFTYDEQGRCVNVTGAEGYYNATLDYGDGCTTVTDGKGTHRYYYDPDGNILREEAPDGSTTTYEWDEFHHLLARHSPAGRVEKFEYNAALGQLSRYTAADGAEWLYRYDERGLLSNITDPAGQTWTQQCDERGLPVSLVSPQGEETRLAYTAQGLLSGIFRQDERRLGIEYDHHNRPETLTDVMGREHHTEYSGHDLPVKMRGPGGQSVRLQWQQHHKLSGIERAGTGAEGFRYDRHGNLLAYTDGNGVVWTMEYGPFDLPVARTDGEGHRWQYRYDKDTLQLTEVINPQGESYRYILDNCGRVTEERDWGGVVWRYRYDADGLCTARVNGLEETILYSRDAAGRLAEVITPEGKTQYAYDKSGRLTGIFSPDGISQRTGYDERGRVNVTTQGRRAIEYHHPDEHTVIRCILPPEDERDRHPDESLLKTTYRYNAAGELTEIILPGDETLTFSRDEAGREVLRHSNRGFACEQGWNAAGQPVSQRAGFFPAEATWGGLVPSLVREYRYDSAGNVSGVTSREDYGRETRREYRLDRNGQVTAVTASGTGLGYGEGDESYGYDSCGYLKAQSAGRHRISEETDQYAGGHRLKQAGNTQYDYDAAGRMVSRTKHRDGYRPETERFRWDSLDQLTGYCSAQGEQWEYRYDASGRRTEKRCDRKKIRFTYLWDGDSIAEIREYRDDKLYSVRHLVFNGFELISQQFSRVRQPHPSVAPLWVTRTNHAVSDLTGRPLMLFNSEGKTVWRPGQTSLWGLALSLPADTGYPDPRGELDPEADPGLLYAGQWQDAESGLCYNRFRYYEPETGMYLVSDPLGLLGGEQTYRYVPNPCGWVDPLGLAASSKISSLMDYIGDGRRVSGHTGFLDGVRLSRSQINNIAKEMEKLGIKVIRKADKYLPPNARAAFDYGLRNIYLRKNATLYEVYHEVIHAKQFAKIGREAYEALGRLSREEHVLNEILKSKNLFNEAKIAHAIKYVEGLREKFMMGLTN